MVKLTYILSDEYLEGSRVTYVAGSLVDYVIYNENYREP